MIKLENVSFQYQNQKVLHDLSLLLPAHQTIGLIGENGSGKSTLLQLMIGLLELKEGSITVKAVDVNAKNKSRIQQMVGYTFQNADHQLFMPTVYEEVAFALRNRKMPETDIEAVVSDSLEMVKALHLKDKAPFRLSGGEKRRVALATVLAMNPEILLFDEPTIGLDPKARRRFMNVMKTLNQMKIIATHDLDLAYDVCDVIVLLKDGCIEGFGKKEDILKNELLLERNGLELPLKFQK